MNIKRIGLIGGSGVGGGNGFTKIVNDLTTGGIDKALSAEQGKILNSTKQNTLNGTEFKTVNGSSIWGSGNIVITGEGSSVEIVNDLITGGADKALSAEMGKVLGEELHELGSEHRIDYVGEHEAYSRVNFSFHKLKKGGIVTNRGVNITFYKIDDNNIKTTIKSGDTYELLWDAKNNILVDGSSGTVDFTFEYYSSLSKLLQTKQEFEGFVSNRVFISGNKNLFIEEGSTKGMFITSTGEFSKVSSNYIVTDYLKIEPSTNYILTNRQGVYPGGSNTYYAFYDKYLNLIGVDKTANILTPDNACYIRCSILISMIDNVMLELGDVRTDYIKGSPIWNYVKHYEELYNELYPRLTKEYKAEHVAYSNIPFSDRELEKGGIITNRGVNISAYNADDDSSFTIPTGTSYVLTKNLKKNFLCGSTAGLVDIVYEYYTTKAEIEEYVNKHITNVQSNIDAVNNSIGKYTEEKVLHLTLDSYNTAYEFIPKDSTFIDFGGYDGGLLICPQDSFDSNDFITIYPNNLPYITQTDIKTIRPNKQINNDISYIVPGVGVKKDIEMLSQKIDNINPTSIKPLGSTYKGNMIGGDLIILEKNSVKGEESFSFTADINTFTGIRFGRGTPNEKLYGSSWIDIDNTNIIIHTYYSSTQLYENTYPHGLTITNNIQILLHNPYEGDSTIVLVSNGKMFEQKFTWNGYNGHLFVESFGSILNNVVYSWTCKKLNSDIWLFGDSYFSLTSESRWTSYLIKNGFKNLLFNAYAGEGVTQALADLQTLIQHQTPKYIVWCMGMNNKDTETSVNADWNSTFNTLKDLCKANSIELILSTIPTVKGGYVEDTNEYNLRIHKFKNAIVRSSNLRYIDFDKAVGANEDTGEWYGDMLYTDGVHPAIAGARALFMQAIADFPELMSAENF